MDTKLSLLETPASILASVAAGARAARLRRGWSRKELARRAGVSPAMIKNFERTGRIGVVRLVALAGALGALREFAALFPAPPAASLDELEEPQRPPTRRRGRTLAAPTTTIPTTPGRTRAR